MSWKSDSGLVDDLTYRGWEADLLSQPGPGEGDPEKAFNERYKYATAGSTALALKKADPIHPVPAKGSGRVGPYRKSDILFRPFVPDARKRADVLATLEELHPRGTWKYRIQIVKSLGSYIADTLRWRD